MCFFNEMDIPLPDHRLNISGVGHAAMTGRMMEALESIFLDEKADVVMVYGDTNSTLAGALAASKNPHTGSSCRSGFKKL